MKTFYVYCYLRNKDSITAKAGTPYYVGKGSGNRAFSSNRRTINVPKDLNNIKFLATNLYEWDAFQLEMNYIYIYGRKDEDTGILRNHTDGGEGTSGFKNPNRKRIQHSEETKHKMSLAHKGKAKSPEMVFKLMETMRLRREAKPKKAKIYKLYKSPESIERLSKAAKLRWIKRKEKSK
jgi:NUMOD3 motif